MKDAFIMSSLPPEEDPLLAGLQGVDTVIEHFIKNAQGELRKLTVAVLMDTTTVLN